MVDTKTADDIRTSIRVIESLEEGGGIMTTIDGSVFDVITKLHMNQRQFMTFAMREHCKSRDALGKATHADPSQ